MKDSSTQLNRIHDILTHLHGQPPRGLRLQVKALRGGLDALAVLLVKADFEDSRGRGRTSYMVIKRLDGPAAREVSVYEQLVAQHAREIAPRLLAVDPLPALREQLLGFVPLGRAAINGDVHPGNVLADCVP